MSDLSISQLADLKIAVQQEQAKKDALAEETKILESRHEFLTEDTARLDKAVADKNFLLNDKQKEIAELDKKYTSIQSEFNRTQEQKFKENDALRVETEQKLGTLELRALEIEGREKNLAEKITANDDRAQSLNLMIETNTENSVRIANERNALEDEKQKVAKEKSNIAHAKADLAKREAEIVQKKQEVAIDMMNFEEERRKVAQDRIDINAAAARNAAILARNENVEASIKAYRDQIVMLGVKNTTADVFVATLVSKLEEYETFKEALDATSESDLSPAPGAAFGEVVVDNTLPPMTGEAPVPGAPIESQVGDVPPATDVVPPATDVVPPATDVVPPATDVVPPATTTTEAAPKKSSPKDKTSVKPE